MASSKIVRPQELSSFGHALAGALGGVFSNAVVYPLDTVKTRIQAADEKGKRKMSTPSVYELLVKIWRKEGISGYYKGFGASMLNTFSTQYAYFFFYSWVRNAYLRRRARTTTAGNAVAPISAAVELLLGAIAGALAQIFTIPVAVIATRQQLSDKSETQGSRQRGDSFLEVGQEIIEEDGITGLWTGLRPGLVLTVNPAITYGTFERLKSGLFAPDARLSPSASFFMGAFSKTLATIVTYPYIMAKVRLQARPAAEEKDEETALQTSIVEGSSFINIQDESVGVLPPPKPRYDGAIDLLKKTLAEKGFAGWYQGMGAQITKAVLSQALLFMLKDQFEQYALILMLLWGRFTQKRSLA